MEEGFGDIAHSVERSDIGRIIREGQRGGGGDMMDGNRDRDDSGSSDRRLSQELERGFRDSSSDEEDDRRLRRARR